MSWEVRCPSFQIPALANEEVSGKKYWMSHCLSLGSLMAVQQCRKMVLCWLEEEAKVNFQSMTVA